MTAAYVKRCGPCTKGIVPGDKLYFDPECPGCQEKLAAGKRTGLEPHPRTRRQKFARSIDSAGMDQAKFDATVAQLKQQAADRARFFSESAPLRRAR
jgi:hypothetical protein